MDSNVVFLATSQLAAPLPRLQALQQARTQHTAEVYDANPLATGASVQQQQQQPQQPAGNLWAIACGVGAALLAGRRRFIPGARDTTRAMRTASAAPSAAGASRVVRHAQMQPDLPDAGIAVMDKEDVKKKMKEEFQKEKWWRVLLHNDEIHTFEYVTGCLTRVCKHLSRRKAYNITWEAHSSGMATVTCVWKALAENQSVELQQLGLTVSIAPDSSFSGNKGNQ